MALNCSPSTASNVAPQREGKMAPNCSPSAASTTSSWPLLATEGESELETEFSALLTGSERGSPACSPLSTPATVARLAAKALQGVAPLLPQLPTDSLGPALDYRRHQIAVARGVTLPKEVVAEVASLGCDFESVATTCLAILMGRYAQCNDVALCAWSLGGWAPLRVGLLLPESERTGDAEDSVVTPAGAFARVRDVAKQVAADLEEVRELGARLTGRALAALDRRLSGAETEGQILRSLEVGICFGRPARAMGEPQHMLTVVFPSFSGARAARRAAPMELHYPKGVFSEATAGRVLRHLASLLVQASVAWDGPACGVELNLGGRSGEVRRQAAACGLREAEDVTAWSDAYASSCYFSGNAAAQFFDADRSILTLFDEQVARDPGVVALVDDATGAWLSYSALDLVVKCVAASLVRAGVGPDVLVPLFAPRCTAMVVGMLGIIRAGGAYVPMDSHWPDDRLADVLEQCHAGTLLATRGTCFDRLQALKSGAVVHCIEDLMTSDVAAVDAPARRAKGRDLVYVFFTSGTTGKPKGVMVEHRGLLHRIHWFQATWPLSPGEGVLQKISYTFGLSEWEIFWPLSSGATLVLAPPGGEKDPDYLLRRACGAFVPPQPSEGPAAPVVPLAAHVFVPSALQMVLEQFDELEETEARRKASDTSEAWWRAWPARQVVTCGEPLTGPVAQRLLSRLPRASLINLYGPTEGEMTLWTAPRGRALLRVPAGAPMAGSKVVLADLRERRAAGGLEPAEIAFGGPFIARGYLGRPDLDAKAFVPDFSGPGEHRLYLTGDLGRWREGQIELLGRRDFQVKLRGFRIELGEIESSVRAAGARAAVCVVRPGAGGAPALVAYYESGAEGALSVGAVKASCKRRLPPYMQPQIFVELEKLPRNPNGKVDRAKLPEPPAASGAEEAVSQSAALPETPTEQAIAAVWAEVLGLKSAAVPMDTDFLELGGTSLLAGKATSLIRSRLQAQGLPGTTMYKYPTIRRLAPVVQAAISEYEASQAAAAEEGVSDAELPPALMPKAPELSNTRPVALAVQFFGVILLSFIFEAQGWSPLFWGGYFAFMWYGMTALYIWLPFGVALEMLVNAMIVVLLKWVVVGKMRPGRYPLWSSMYFRWWFGNRLVNHACEMVLPVIADTPLLPWYLRMLGAEIGSGVRIGVVRMTDPDLVRIGNDVTIGERAKLFSSAVLHGELHLGMIHIEDGAAVGPCALLSQGTRLAANQAVLPLSTAPGWHGAVGSVAMQTAADTIDRAFQRTQDRWRAWVGIPLVVLLSTLPYIPVIMACVWFWYFIEPFFSEDNMVNAFMLLSPWVYGNVLLVAKIATVVLVKQCYVGRFKDKALGWVQSAEFKHWLHARNVESHDFEVACSMLVNTEALSWIYRLLGAKVGRRVQIDKFFCSEHDCVEVGDYAVFGSEVFMTADARAPWTPPHLVSAEKSAGGLGFEPVRLHTAANALDHCTFLPGSTVGERSVLGTCSLAPQHSYFAPSAIYSGSVRGRATYLRDASVTKALKQQEDEAMQDLDSPRTWWGFNVYLVAVALLSAPLPEVTWMITYIILCSFWDPDRHGFLCLIVLLPGIHFLLTVIDLFLLIALKWSVMGVYKEGDHRFFSKYHYKWMTMMLVGHGAGELTSILEGTVFNSWYYRANGAKIGKNCYLAGLVVEYDLLEIGDNVAIGEGCDNTCHTVENMVIKLSPSRVESGACLCPGSFAMPGSVVQEGAVLLEHTQVLKGEVVPSGEVWAGMPAGKCQPRAPPRVEPGDGMKAPLRGM